MFSPTHLRSLQAIQLAVELGSLSAAAERLGITPAAVGQRIKALEDYLDIDLVARGRSGIQPTRALERALPRLDNAFRELAEAAEVLDFQRVREIHIVADPGWAEQWLAPRLPAFRNAHPNILFCINGVGDVPTRLGQADCVVNFDQGVRDNEDLLFRDFLLPVASPFNVERLARLPRESCLEGFPLLHLTTRDGGPACIGWEEWSETFGHRKTAPGRGIRYNRLSPALDAVRSGAGLMICGLALTFDLLDQGELALPFDAWQGAWTKSAYRAAYRHGTKQRPQLARFRDWLNAQSQETRARLATMTGREPD